MDGSAELNFQIGSQAGQDIDVAISSLGSNALGSLTARVQQLQAANSNIVDQGTEAEVTEVKIAFNVE